MARILKWSGLAMAAAIVLLLLLVAAYIFVTTERALAERHDADAEPLPVVPAAMAADAGRQARLLGCTSCHGDRLQGSLMEDIPNVVRIHAPNLPAIAARASDQQLAAAIRQGIGHDGRALFVMPSPMYSQLSDGEVAALVAWLRRQPRVAGSNEGVSFGPLGQLALAKGDISAAPTKLADYRTQAPIGLGPAHEAGRRLVSKSCTACHGPALMGMTMEEGVEAPDLRIAAAYDPAQFRTLMRSGRPPSGRDLGLMTYVARGYFKHYRDDELVAMHAYLSARAERLGR